MNKQATPPRYSAREVVEILEKWHAVAAAVAECMQLAGYEPEKAPRTPAREPIVTHHDRAADIGRCERHRKPLVESNFAGKPPFCLECWREEKDRKRFGR